MYEHGPRGPYQVYTQSITSASMKHLIFNAITFIHPESIYVASKCNKLRALGHDGFKTIRLARFAASSLSCANTRRGFAQHKSPKCTRRNIAQPLKSMVSDAIDVFSGKYLSKPSNTMPFTFVVHANFDRCCAQENIPDQQNCDGKLLALPSKTKSWHSCTAYRGRSGCLRL